MTTPTQAQIEAARKVIAQRLDYEESSAKAWPIAEAALTAAAEARGAKPLPEPELPAGHTEYNAVIADTIELCAQELTRLKQHQFTEDDQFAIGFNEAIREAQYAIRALKDRP